MKKKKQSPDRFVDIDVDNIDEDIAGQPGLRLKWGRKLAEAKKVLADAEADLELKKAEAASAIRSKPKKYGFTDKQPTEAAIKEIILQEEEVQDAISVVNDAQHEVNMIQAGVISIDHKKSMIGDMVSIIALGWFSEPKVRAHAREAKKMLDQRGARKSYRRNDDDEE